MQNGYHSRPVTGTHAGGAVSGRAGRIGTFPPENHCGLQSPRSWRIAGLRRGDAGGRRTVDGMAAGGTTMNGRGRRGKVSE